MLDHGCASFDCALRALRMRPFS